jgi:hypothetical protein
MKSNITKRNLRRNQDYVRLAYSLPEVAWALGISLQRANDYIEHGEIAHFRVVSRILVSHEMLQQFIKQRTQRPVIQNSRVDEP